VPEGVNAVSLYFVNDDGRSAGNRDRDYLIGVARANALRDETAAPTLARARVHNFWGGVYERFALRGPAFYRFEIQKNHSMNAICSGLLIDRIAGPSTFVDGMALPSMGDTRYDPPPSPTDAAKAVASLAAATNLWSSADSIQFASPSLAREQQITACRLAANAGPADLAAWRWQSRLWNDDDRKGFDAATKEAWASFAQQLGINQASAR
jgi:hypothetical protein